MYFTSMHEVPLSYKFDEGYKTVGLITRSLTIDTHIDRDQTMTFGRRSL